MPQKKPEMIKRFIGIASNTITHKILVKTELQDEIRQHYTAEIERDISIALKYRNKINPAGSMLPEKDSLDIKRKILSRVKLELLKREGKGYNVDLSLIEPETDLFLRKNRV